MAYKEALPQLIEEVKPKSSREQRKKEYIKRQQPKKKFHIEVKAYYEKSYKQRNNLWSVPKVEKEPVILSKTIESTDKKNAISSFFNLIDDGIEDTYYIGTCVSSEVTSCFIDDGHEPVGTSNMMMRESHQIN